MNVTVSKTTDEEDHSSVEAARNPKQSKGMLGLPPPAQDHNEPLEAKTPLPLTPPISVASPPSYNTQCIFHPNIVLDSIQQSSETS